MAQQFHFTPANSGQSGGQQFNFTPDTPTQPQQPQQQGNWLQDLLGAARGFGLGAAQDIAAPAYLAGQEVLHGQSPIAGMGNNANSNQLQQYAKSNPFASQQQLQGVGGTLPQAAEQVGKDTAGAASWALAPEAGAGKLAFAGTNLASGALNGLSQDNATPLSVGTDALTSLLTAGVASKIPGLIKGAGQSLSQQGDNVLLHDLKPSVSQQLNFQKASGGQPIENYIKQMGWNGDFVNNSAASNQHLQDAFDQLAGNDKTNVPQNALTQAFSPYINELQTNTIPAVKATAQSMQDHLDNITQKYGDNMTVADLTNERRNLDNVLKPGQYNLPVEAANWMANSRRGLHDAVVNATQGMTVDGKDINQLGKELQKGYAFNEIANKQALMGKGNKNIGIGAQMAAGIGSTPGAVVGNMVGGPVGALLGTLLGGTAAVVGNKALNSGAAVKGESNILRGAGGLLQKAGGTQLPLNGNNYLLRLIRNAGQNGGNAIGQSF